MVNGWGLYEEYSRGTLYLGRINGDAALANENTAVNVEWRAFDRSAFASVDVPPQAATPAQTGSHRIFWFQQNAIQESVSLPVPFSVVHTVVGMQNVLDFGLHTGLYNVLGFDGLRYLCGLYPGALAGETGWVKWNPRTNVWTSGIVAGTTRPSGNRMGPCVAFDAQLCHANNGVLTMFDPAGETINQIPYADGSSIDRVVVSSGGLFIVSAGAGQIKVHQLAFGLHEISNPGAHAINIAGGGEFALMRFGSVDDHNLFYIMFYTTTGGTGSKCYKVETSGPSPVVTETTAMVPTALEFSQLAVPPFTVFFENRQWPGGTAHPDDCYETCFDNVDFVPYVPSVAAPWGHCKLIRTTPPGTIIYNPLKFNGEGVAMNQEALGSPPGGFTGADFLTRSLSVSSSWLGGDDTRNNEGRPKAWPISAVEYSDATTPRGLLVTFWLEGSGAGGVSDVLILIGRNRMRPNQVATLVAGNPVIDYGGTAQFNNALNRLEKCNESWTGGPGNQNRVYDYAPQTVGKVIEPGTTLSEFPAGTKGGVNVFASPLAAPRPARIYMIETSAVFIAAETFQQNGGLNNGELFDLGNGLSSIVHQAIIDLGAIPDGETITIQPLMFGTGMVGNPLADDSTYSGWTLEHLVGPGAVPFQIDAEGPTVDTFTESVGGSGDSEGPTVDTLMQSASASSDSEGPTVDTLTQGGGGDSEGPVVDLLPTTLLTPQDILRGRGSEPHEEGGGVIAWLADGVEGSARNVLNVTNNGKPGEAAALSLGAIPALSLTLDGIIELGRVLVDCVANPANTTFPVVDVTALGLSVVGVAEVKVHLVAAVGVVGMPTIGLGVGGAYDDQVPATPVSLGAVGFHEELPVLQPRPVLRPGDVLEVELDVVAAGTTTYQLEVVVYGFHRIP